jgi:hypothetical protein
LERLEQRALCFEDGASAVGTREVAPTTRLRAYLGVLADGV